MVPRPPTGNRDDVGGTEKPLSSVVFKVVDVDTAAEDAAADKVTEIPTFPGDRAGGGFRLAYALNEVT